MYMSVTWEQHHQLEVAEDYPAAIDALGARLQEDPDDVEVVIRLGFNLWNVVAEWDRVGVDEELAGQYAARFMQLYEQYKEPLSANADFCWAFGLGVHLFWFMLPGSTEQLGDDLMGRAGELDPFYAGMGRGGDAGTSQDEIASRFRGRGILASYYAVA